MIAEHGDHPAAALRRLARKLLQTADDLERVRAAVGDVAKLDQGGVAARPAVPGVDQACRAGDRDPRVIVAVEVADGDDPLLHGSLGRWRKQQNGKQKGRRLDDPMEQGSPLPDAGGMCHCGAGEAMAERAMSCFA